LCCWELSGALSPLDEFVRERETLEPSGRRFEDWESRPSSSVDAFEPSSVECSDVRLPVVDEDLKDVGVFALVVTVLELELASPG
jgi:hypothetical protein